MKPQFYGWLKWPLVGSLWLFFSSAEAARLEVAPESHFILHLLAAILLIAHIGGGTIGILSGMVASLSVKGSQFHRFSGKVFLVSMAMCYVIAAIVAPFLAVEQRTNFVAAILSLYLLVTGLSAARRRHFYAGILEKSGIIVALAIAFTGGVFIYMGSIDPSGTVDGAPPESFFIFVVIGLLGFLGDLRVIIKKQLGPQARIIRHLWRMCLSFFIASGSLYFGQAQLFPEWFNDSLMPTVLVFFPILILVFSITKFKVQQHLLKKSH